jgi:hypothetical protein
VTVAEYATARFWDAAISGAGLLRRTGTRPEVSAQARAVLTVMRQALTDTGTGLWLRWGEDCGDRPQLIISAGGDERLCLPAMRFAGTAPPAARALFDVRALLPRPRRSRGLVLHCPAGPLAVDDVTCLALPHRTDPTRRAVALQLPATCYSPGQVAALGEFGTLLLEQMVGEYTAVTQVGRVTVHRVAMAGGSPLADLAGYLDRLV